MTRGLRVFVIFTPDMAPGSVHNRQPEAFVGAN